MNAVDAIMDWLDRHVGFRSAVIFGVTAFVGACILVGIQEALTCDKERTPTDDR